MKNKSIEKKVEGANVTNRGVPILSEEVFASFLKEIIGKDGELDNKKMEDYLGRVRARIISEDEGLADLVESYFLSVPEESRPYALAGMLLTYGAIEKECHARKVNMFCNKYKK